MKIFREAMLFGRFHIDFLGPFQPSIPKGYRYVVVVVEAFSSWSEAIPLYTKEAREVARALVNHVFSRLGAPAEIITDQETTFESNLYKEVMQIYKIHKSRVSIAKPSSNGKVEKFIQCLTKQISVLAEDEPDNWPDLMPHVLHAYRAACHKTNKFSPYEILFGRRMRVPLDLVHGIPPDRITEITEQSLYPEVLRARLDKIHKIVRENIEGTALRMKAHYDKTSTPIYFRPNDIVLLYNPRRRKGKSPKLHSAWEGPYVILDLLNDCIARIEEVLSTDRSGAR